MNLSSLLGGGDWQLFEGKRIPSLFYFTVAQIAQRSIPTHPYQSGRVVSPCKDRTHRCGVIHATSYLQHTLLLQSCFTLPLMQIGYLWHGAFFYRVGEAGVGLHISVLVLRKYLGCFHTLFCGGNGALLIIQTPLKYAKADEVVGPDR